MNPRNTSALHLLLLVACTPLTNEPLMRPGIPPNGETEIADLSRFMPMSNVAATASPFELVTRTAQRATPPATFVFSTPAGLWSGMQVGTQVMLSRTAPNGAVQETRTIDLTEVPASETAYDVAAGADGAMWVAIEQSDGRGLLAAFTATASGATTLVDTIGLSVAPPPEHWRDTLGLSLSIADGRMYVGGYETLIVLDEATGSVIADWSPQLEQEIGPTAGSSVQAVGAGHGRVLVRMWPEDFDTISFAASTGAVTGRVAGVPVGGLTGTPTGFAGIDEHGQVAEFVIDRQVGIVIERLSRRRLRPETAKPGPDHQGSTDGRQPPPCPRKSRHVDGSSGRIVT